MTMATALQRRSPVDGRRYETLDRWKKRFSEGTDFDNWGQVVEANEIYESIRLEMGGEVQQPKLHFAAGDMVILRKIIRAIELRCTCIHSPEVKDSTMAVSDIKAIANAFQNWNEGLPLPELSKVALPMVRGIPFVARRQSEMEMGDDDNDEEDGAAHLDRREIGESNLLLKPALGPGKTLLTIRLEKIGLKDAPQHIDPFFTISVKDTAGKDVATPQKTGLACRRSDLYLEFDVDIYLDIAVEDFPRDAAMFFELWHYKQKKRKSSTKCFSFLEKDEIKEGTSVLEVYRKPANFKRKKLSLLTVKPLYLHLTLKTS